MGVRNLDLVGLLARELLVVLVADDDGATLTGDDLLVGVERLGEDGVTGEDHDDGEVLVDESEDTVLQLTGHDGLAVEVTNLLDLEGALESGSVLRATAKEEKRLLVLELEAHLLDALVELEDLPELLGDLGKTVHDFQTLLSLACTVLRQSKSEHDHADKLRSVGLGGGDTDLGTGVDVDTAVGHEGDAGADNVDNTDGQGATLQAVAESHEGVGGLTGLGDEDAGVVTEDRSLTIEEVGGQLDRDRDLSQVLESTANSHARVVGGTASDEDQTSAAPDGADVLAKSTEGDGLLLCVQATTHSVDNRLGLLEDLLLHEVVEATLHDLLELDLDGLDSTDIASAVGLGQTVDVELTLVDVGNVIILEVEDLLGVLDDGRGVGREEELGGLGHAVVGQEGTGLRTVEERLVGGEAGDGKKVVASLEGNVVAGGLSREGLAVLSVLDIDEVNLHLLGGLDTDDERRTLTGSDNLTGEVHTLHQKTESTLQLLHDSLDQAGEVEVRVLVEDELGQLSDGLSVGLGLEAHALGFEEHPQFLVVGDDTVVDDGELPLGVGAVRVAVDPAGRAVGGPSGVCNTGVVVEDLSEVGLLLLDELLQLGDLANFLEGEDLVLLVAIDGDTGGVVAAVFETGETCGREECQLGKDWDGMGWWGFARPRTVDEGVEDELPVLLDEVVDVSEDSAHDCCEGM